MGDPKKRRKQYERPRRPWDKQRIEHEKKLKETYGLVNKKELRRIETILRKKRQNARKLLALHETSRTVREKELLDSLNAMGILKENASLDDVLGLNIEEFLERRLQTIAWRKNLAKTVKQARQFIVHGHIALNGKKINCPNYFVKKGEDARLGYFGKPPELEPPKPDKKEKLSKKFEEMAAEETKETRAPKTEEKTETKREPKEEKAAEEKEKTVKKETEEKAERKKEGVKENA